MILTKVKIKYWIELRQVTSMIEKIVLTYLSSMLILARFCKRPEKAVISHVNGDNAWVSGHQQIVNQ